MEKSLSRVEGPLTLEQHLSEKLLKQRERQAIAEDHRLARARDSEKQRAIDDLTRAAYTAAMIEHGQEYLRKDLQNATSDDERNLKVLTYMMSERKALDDLIEDSSDNELAQTKREKIRRLGRKAMGAAGTWLSKGNKKTQFAKGFAIATGASLALGAAGGIAVAAGGMAALRYGKSYAKGRARKITRGTSGSGELRATMLEKRYSNVHETFNAASEMMNAEREKVVGRYQTNNQKAHKSARRAVVIGALVGAFMPEVFESFGLESAHTDEIITPPIVDTSPDIVMSELAHADTLEPMLIDDVLVEPELFSHDTIDAIGADDEIVQPGIMAHADGIDAQTIEADDIVRPPIIESDTLPAIPIDEELVQPGLPEASDTSSAVLINDELYQPAIIEGGDTLPAMTIDGDIASPALPSGVLEQAPGVVVEGGSHELKLAEDSFTVEGGHGYANELIEAAKANGIELSGKDAWEAHQAIVDKVGTDYIDLVDYAGVDTYSMGHSPYEVGISAPGEATWTPEAQPMIADLLDDGVINDSIDVGSVHEGVVAQDMAVDGDLDAIELAAAEPQGELPAVDSGEGIDSFVGGNYDHTLTHDQSIDLGAQLEQTGYVYESDHLAETFGNPYGITEAGQVDTGFNTIVSDMVGNPETGDAPGLDTEYSLSTDDWSQIEDMLKGAAAQDALGEISAQGSTLMHDLGPMLKGIVYPDGSSIASTDVHGNWLLNDSDSPLPQKAFDTIYRYLNIHDTAYDTVQDLFDKVL